MSATGAVDIIVNNEDDVSGVLSVHGDASFALHRVVMLDGDDTLIEGRRYRDTKIHWFDTFFNSEMEPSDIKFPALIIYVK